MKAIPRALVAFGAALVACAARGQAPATAPTTPWQFSLAVSYYDVPDAQDFWNPIFTADHGRLHLEARHNYVSIDTTSLWAGVNFNAGKEWAFGATLLFGGVTGSVDGAGLGYELSLNRAWFALSGQGEFIYNTREDTDDSLYSWTEVTGSPVDWCRLGVVLQTTHNYGLKDDIQPGAAVAFSYKQFALEADVLDPLQDDTTFIFTLTWTF